MHKSHWDADAWEVVLGNVRASLLRETPDLLIDAGDCECDVAEELGIAGLSVMSVKGNHDWWGQDFAPQDRFDAHRNLRDTVAHVADGFLAVGCTLWTDYDGGNPLAMLACMNWGDFKHIASCTPRDVYEEHLCCRAWLKSYRREVNSARPDVVVTHHSPSFRSVAEKYWGKPSNAGFASNLDHLVYGIAPKLWVHGHMHDAFDYHIGDTRMICNPCGYPREAANRPVYLPVYIEI